MVRKLLDGMMASVRDQQDFSGRSKLQQGLKQGCTLAPTLFSIVFSPMLQDLCRKNTVINIIYCFNGGLLNLRRLQTKTKVEEVTIRELLFADDCAVVASSNEVLQANLDHFSSACSNFGQV